MYFPSTGTQKNRYTEHNFLPGIYISFSSLFPISILYKVEKRQL